MSKFLLTLAAVVFTVGTVACQSKSPRVTAEGTTAKVSYGQPSKRGRVIFGATGALETYGKVWRTGANASTEITFKRDVKFGGQSVKAGTYSLFTIPNATEWTIILNSKLGQSGAFEYESNKAMDIATIKVPAKNDNAEAEKLTLSFKTVGTAEHLVIEWDKTRVEAEIK
jgi:Protein of unknown function (DUF2911)